MRIALESYCTGLVNWINSCHDDITLICYRVDEIRFLMKNFVHISIRWVHRDCNKVANQLSSLAINSHCNLDFDMDYPSDIHFFCD